MNKSNNRSLINYLKILYSPFSANQLIEDEIMEQKSTIYYLHDGSGRKRTGAHGGEVPVFDLNNGFSMYASVSYKHGRVKNTFDGVSLQFFYKMLLLFRAELSHPNKEETVDHPQPHWHFHVLLDRPYQKEKVQSNFNVFVKQQKQFEISLTKEQSLSDMHFLMNYQQPYFESTEFDKTWDESNVKAWLKNTSTSILKELEFIKDKLHIV